MDIILGFSVNGGKETTSDWIGTIGLGAFASWKKAIVMAIAIMAMARKRAVVLIGIIL